MKLIERPDILKEIVSYKDTTGIIKVITGIRRCGKSTLFRLYQDYLLNNEVKKEQIISINLDDIRNSNLLEAKNLFDSIESKLLKDKMNYIFLDEIQNVDKFQWVLNTLNNMENVDLYVTGSNAYLLSGELSTLLSGRYMQIKVYPLSFKEYLSCFDEEEKKDKKKIFNYYKKYGGFPYTLTFKEDKILEYLESIYSTIIVKDVMQRGKLIDKGRLEKIILFLAGNIGSLTSINNIKNQMVSDNFKISTITIESYIDLLINCFFIYKVPRYDIKGKELLKTNDKYYIVDTGLRYHLLQNNDDNRGYVLENIVYLELLRRGYRVYIGKIDNLEVDFIAIKNNITLYVQVCETMTGEKTREREFRPLETINDNYKKIIVTEENLLADNKYGIEYINIIDWLLE